MIIINLLGLLLIALIVWWFWLYKPAVASTVDDTIKVIVDNGVYTPARISYPPNKTLTMDFMRKDASPCAAMVGFPDLKISQELTVGKVTRITLPPLAVGEYPFTCQMQMYRGLLVVE